MAVMYYDKDADLSLLNGKNVAVIGYGSQGHAHALNMRESGVNVVIGLHEGSKSRAKAEADGLTVLPVGEAVKQADVVMILIPDTKQAEVYEKEVAANLKPGSMLMFAHGFNIHFGQIKPPANVDVTMIAPKAPGHRVREVFKEGAGTPGLLAVQQDATGNAKALALVPNHPKALAGSARADLLENKVAEAQATADSAVTASPRDAEAWIVKGDSARVKKDLDGAAVPVVVVARRAVGPHVVVDDGRRGDLVYSDNDNENLMRAKQSAGDSPITPLLGVFGYEIPQRMPGDLVTFSVELDRPAPQQIRRIFVGVEDVVSASSNDVSYEVSIDSHWLLKQIDVIYF